MLYILYIKWCVCGFALDLNLKSRAVILVEILYITFKVASFLKL